MTTNKNFGELATEESINKTKESLEKHGIKVLVVENGEAAKQKALEIIPEGAEIMNMSSVTVDSIGLAKEINESGKFNSVRNKFATMDKVTQGLEMNKLGAAPEWAVGSVHAVTEDGKVVVVSATGSQLSSYAYGSSHVLWIVGSQKIVKDIKEAFERVSDYVFPLENERAMKAYGKGSGVNKELVINKEVNPGRLTMIIVKEKLGF
jgi:L-lactate utilization protein LutC